MDIQERLEEVQGKLKDAMAQLNALERQKQETIAETNALIGEERGYKKILAQQKEQEARPKKTKEK